ncbi:MAG: proline racemase family protein, partial [Solirubrobacteraceae bacterium]
AEQRATREKAQASSARERDMLGHEIRELETLAFDAPRWAEDQAEHRRLANAQELIERGLEVISAINASALPVHPVDPAIRGCKHVVFYAPGRDGANARNATAIHPGWLDRSPCGTGTSARMAALHARGELALGEAFVNESIIGSRFTGRLLEEVNLGSVPAVVPEVSGRAWITGMSQYLLDPTDPFPAGFAL